MPESGSDQHHSRVPIRKAADNPGTATNLFHDAFETVICLQPASVLIREVHFVFLRYIFHGLFSFRWLEFGHFSGRYHLFGIGSS